MKFDFSGNYCPTRRGFAIFKVSDELSIGKCVESNVIFVTIFAHKYKALNHITVLSTFTSTHVALAKLLC